MVESRVSDSRLIVRRPIDKRNSRQKYVKNWEYLPVRKSCMRTFDLFRSVSTVCFDTVCNHIISLDGNWIAFKFRILQPIHVLLPIKCVGEQVFFYCPVNSINTTQTEYSETKTDVLTDVTTAPQVNSLHSEHAPAELNGEPVINAQSVLTVETFPDQETKLADETANNAHSTKVDSAHIDSVLVPASSAPQAHVISSSLPAERGINFYC